MRQTLPKTYYPFFARFRHPTPIQQAAAQPLAAGASLLLVSATASGKTEAFTAPLVERYFEDLKAGTGQILIVCPTRALVNDAARRLLAPLRACGLRLARRTGDASDDPAQAGAALWLTTPEGLDSLLARHARWLARTRALVLDEIHLLLGSPRGTQALCLLSRLDKVCAALSLPAPQRVGATATATRPRSLARAFLGEGAGVLEESSQRPVRLRYDRWIDYDALRDTLADLPAGRKVLLFAGSRNEAEEAAADMTGKPPYGNNVWVHHASLSRSRRLTVEQAFLKQRSGLLCCTTTMEVGVDVGDVDWTVLLHPPEDRLSFLQRAGRSGRRAGPAQALAVCRSDAEELRYRFYMNRERPEAQPGDAGLEEPWHDSVVVQQALSLLWQSPRRQVTARALLERLPAPLAQRWEEEELNEVLDNLAAKKWLIREGGGPYLAGPRLERAARLGHLHGNFGDSQQRQVEIRDQVTGKSLGSVVADRQGRVPSLIRLGGRSHRLRQDRHQKVLLAQPSALEAEGGSAAYGPAAPVDLAASQEFGRWLGAAPRCLLSGPQGNLLGHFLGSCWGQILRRHLEQHYPGALIYADAYVVAWQGSMVAEVWNEDALRACMHKFAAQVRRQLGVGRWFELLPRKRQRRELSRLLHWNWIRERWLSAGWDRPSAEAGQALRQLLQKDHDFTIAGFFPIEAEDL